MSISNRLAAYGRVLNAELPDATETPTTGRIMLQGQTGHRWRAGPVLNQGRSDACTGFAWAACLLAAPMGDPEATTAEGNALGMACYEHPSNARSFGSERGAGYAVEHGLIDSYARVEGGIGRLAHTVSTTGPVVLSLPWYSSMSNPNRSGLIRYRRRRRIGGHCLLVVAYVPDRIVRRARRWPKRRPARTAPVFRLRNSWGKRWGKRGDAFITAHDLRKLMRDSDFTAAAVYPVGTHRVDAAAVLASTPTT